MSDRLIKLTMPRPCSNKWEDMLVSEGGRYCNSCATVVKDFSGMSDKEISNYFIEKKVQKICGRIYKNQLERITIRIPRYLAQKKISYLHKFLLILLICFGQSVFSVMITGHSSSDLYAQTAQAGKKKKKKRKHRSYPVATEMIWDKMIVCGNMVPLEEDRPPWEFTKKTSVSFGQDSVLKREMYRGSGNDPKSPAPKNNQGYAEAVLPFIRLRKKISNKK